MEDTFKVENISCNWFTEKTCYTDLISFGYSNDPEQWSDIEDEINHVISEDNFVYFLKPEDDMSCRLDIKFSDSTCLITKLSIVSEARIVEIYGKHGEYLATSHAELLDSRNGLNFHNCQPNICTTQQISIKFLGLKGNGMWLFGIKCLLNNKENQNHLNNDSSTFDFNLINKKLISLNTPVTERAEQFKFFLETYNHNKKIDPKFNNQKMASEFLLQLTQNDCFSHLISKEKINDVGKDMNNVSLSHLMTNILKIDSLKDTSISGDKEEIKNTDEVIIMNGNNNDDKNCIKEYIDESLRELEKKLQKNFEKQLEQIEAKQNEKLDAILSLLKGPNSVKT